MTHDEELDLQAWVIPAGGQKFVGRDFRQLCGPQVYMFLDDEGAPLYVGMSRSGLARAAAKNHLQAAKARSMCSEVFIWPTRNERSALSLESFLIRKLQPRFNRRVGCIPEETVERVAELRGVTCHTAKLLMRREARLNRKRADPKTGPLEQNHFHDAAKMVPTGLPAYRG